MRFDQENPPLAAGLQGVFLQVQVLSFDPAP